MSDRITFKCLDCGTPVPDFDHDPANDAELVMCTGCGRTFGTQAQVREAAIQAGHEVIDKMIDDANLPPWITRK